MITVVPAVELGESAKKQISKVFIDGFGKELEFFSKNNEKLISACEHMFLLEAFYVALIDGEVAGIAACTDGTNPSVKIDVKQFRKHLGFYKGTLAGFLLKPQFEDHPYPFVMESGMASVEFVATSNQYRRKGVAATIIKHIMSVQDDREFVLEVADINTGAIDLYRKLGFEELMRVKHKYKLFSGIHYLVYMKYTKTSGS